MANLLKMKEAHPRSSARSALLLERVLVVAAELALALAVAALQKSKQLGAKLHLVRNSRHDDKDELPVPALEVRHRTLATDCVVNPAQSRCAGAWPAANRSC